MVKVTKNIWEIKNFIFTLKTKKNIKLHLYKKKSTDTDFFNNIRYIYSFNSLLIFN